MVTKYLLTVPILVLVTIMTSVVHAKNDDKNIIETFQKDCNNTKFCMSTDEKDTTLVRYDSLTKMFHLDMISSPRSSSSDQFYYAIGFSQDKEMADDLVIYCRKLKSKSEPEIGMAWTKTTEKNVDLIKSKDILDQIKDKEVKVNGNYLICKFTVPEIIIGGPGKPTINLLTKTYFLLMAKGDTKDAGILGEFHYLYVSSTEKVNFTNPGKAATATEKSKEIAFFIHINGMILTFTFFMPVGIFISRYYKQTWTKKHVLGKRFWHFLHICCMMSALISGLTGLLGWLAKENGSDILTNTQSDGLSNIHLHKIFGWTGMAFLFYQSTTHWIRPSSLRLRRITSVIHACFGLLTYSIGNLIIIISTTWTKPVAENCVQKRAIAILNLIIVFVFNLLMASYIAWTDNHLDIRGCRSFCTLPLRAITVEEAPRPKLLKISLLVFIVCVACGSITTCVLYSSYDENCRSFSANSG